MASGGSQQTTASTSAFEIALPFERCPCNRCLHEGSGQYVLLNINGAEQHFNTHHRVGESSSYSLDAVKGFNPNTQHSAIYPNALAQKIQSTQVSVANSATGPFRHRGLSRYERAAHTVTRNDKRVNAVNLALQRPAAQDMARITRYKKDTATGPEDIEKKT